MKKKGNLVCSRVHGTMNFWSGCLTGCSDVGGGVQCRVMTTEDGWSILVEGWQLTSQIGRSNTESCRESWILPSGNWVQTTSIWICSWTLSSCITQEVKRRNWPQCLKWVRLRFWNHSSDMVIYNKLALSGTDSMPNSITLVWYHERSTWNIPWRLRMVHHLGWTARTKLR